MYYVHRHGGNSNHEWKVVLKTKIYHKAKEKFDKIKIDLRQGGVRLLHDEKILKEEFAYRNRTKW